MNASGLLQSYPEALQASLSLQETRSIHDSMNLPKIEFISEVAMMLMYTSLARWLFQTK